MRTTPQQPTHQRRQVRVRKVALDYPQRPCHPIPLAEATTATLVVVAGDVGVGAVLATACLAVSVQAGKISATMRIIGSYSAPLRFVDYAFSKCIT